MKIYISLPITGYDESERRHTCEKIRAELLEQYPEAEVTSPFDLADKVRKKIPNPTYGDYISEDIAFIIGKADVIHFAVNPLLTDSKGVKLEFFTALIYSKDIQIKYE